MVSIKQAPTKSTEFAGATLGSQQANTARLLEVETVTVEGKEAWQITLSFTSFDQLGPMEPVLQPLAAAASFSDSKFARNRARAASDSTSTNRQGWL